VTVVKLTGGGVRIGIEAPPELAVVREELARALQEADANVLPFPIPESVVE
jgi:carbon storage regulator